MGRGGGCPGGQQRAQQRFSMSKNRSNHSFKPKRFLFSLFERLFRRFTHSMASESNDNQRNVANVTHKPDMVPPCAHLNPQI